MIIQRLGDFPKLSKIPKLIALDFETKENSMEMEAFSFAFHDGKKNRGYFVPVDYPFDEDDVVRNIGIGNASVFLEKLVKNRRVIFHNAQFDLTVLHGVNIEIPDENVEDTMLMHWVLDTEREHGLKPIMANEYGKGTGETYEEARSGDFKQFAAYGIRDARYTLWLWHQLDREMSKHTQVRKLYREVEIPFIRVLQEMNYWKNMLRIDETLLKRYMDMLDAEIKTIKELLLEEFGNREINLNSTQQLAPFLRKKGYRVNKTEKGNPSLGEGELLRMQEEQGGIVIDALLYYRGLVKLQSTYVRGLYDRLEMTSEKIFYITRYDFAHIGTRTGRLSGHNPNLQNQPRDPIIMQTHVLRHFKGDTFLSKRKWNRFCERRKKDKFFQRLCDKYSIDLRKIFIPMPGRVFIGADYSQLELRMMAHLSGDKVMKDAYMQGRDFHQETADRLSKIAGTEISRQDGKTINFALQYGMWYRALARTLGISERRAEKIWDSYNTLFAGRTKFVQDVHASARKSHFVRTILGRRRNIHTLGINDHSPEGFGRRNYAQNASISTIVSGSSSDLIKLAMLHIHAKYPKLRCVMQIHDELVYEVKEELAEKYLPIVKKEMENAMKLSVPIVADAAIGKNWRAVH